MAQLYKLSPIIRQAFWEAFLTGLFGPAILLTLRQIFVHEHPLTVGPLVDWSISQVMLFGDTLLVLAVTLSTVYNHDLVLRGGNKLLPAYLTKPWSWLFCAIVTMPLAYLALIRADPFADQLALRPHAWIFQWWHVIFGAYVSARLSATILKRLGIGIIRLRRLRRHHTSWGIYYPTPTGSDACFMMILIMVFTFWIVYFLHPADYHVTVGWLNVG